MLGCNVQNGTTMVRAIDTYNIVNSRFNYLDSSEQNQVSVSSTELSAVIN